MDEPTYTLGPVTSLLIWRAAMQGLVHMPVKPSVRPDFEGSRSAVRKMRTIPILQALGDVPIDALVSASKRTHACDSLDMMVLRGSLPEGSLWEVGKGVYVCSPELCFVLFARGGFDLHLLEIGSELCGTYSLSYNQTGRYCACKQLTSCKKLGDYLSQMGGRHGIKVARRALGYLQDGSASPFETALYLALTLDSVYGGYGIKNPKLHGTIDIPEQVRPLSEEECLTAALAYARGKGEVYVVGECDDCATRWPRMDVRQAQDTYADDKEDEAIPWHEIAYDYELDIVLFRERDLQCFDMFERKVMRLGRLVGREPAVSEGVLLCQRLQLLHRLFDAGQLANEHVRLRKMAGYERVVSRARFQEHSCASLVAPA